MKPLKTRIAAAQRRARGNLRLAFRNESGAFDLPSILVGVLVVAVMALGVMAIVFGIIPFAQDKSAEQTLAAIATAEGTYRAQSTDSTFTTNTLPGSYYAGLADLRTEKLLGSEVGKVGTPSEKTVSVSGGAKGWVAVTKSDSDQWYLSTSEAPTPLKIYPSAADITTGSSAVLTTQVTAFTAAKLGTVNP